MRHWIFIAIKDTGLGRVCWRYAPASSGESEIQNYSPDGPANNKCVISMDSVIVRLAIKQNKLYKLIGSLKRGNN